MNNYSSAERSADAKKQIRDRNGRWVEMGGKVNWFSKTAGKMKTGTLVGTDGKYAYVLPPLENPTHRPMPFMLPMGNVGMSPKSKATLDGRDDATKSAESSMVNKMMSKFNGEGSDDEDSEDKPKGNPKPSPKPNPSPKPKPKPKPKPSPKPKPKPKPKPRGGKANTEDYDFEADNRKASTDSNGKTRESSLDSKDPGSDYAKFRDNLSKRLASDKESSFKWNGFTTSSKPDGDFNEVTIRDSDGNIVDSFRLARKNNENNQANGVSNRLKNILDSADDSEEYIVDVDRDGVPDHEDDDVTLNTKDGSWKERALSKDAAHALPVGSVITQDDKMYVKTARQTPDKKQDGLWLSYQQKSGAQGSYMLDADSSGKPKLVTSTALGNKSEYMVNEKPAFRSSDTDSDDTGSDDRSTRQRLVDEAMPFLEDRRERLKNRYMNAKTQKDKEAIGRHFDLLNQRMAQVTENDPELFDAISTELAWDRGGHNLEKSSAERALKKAQEDGNPRTIERAQARVDKLQDRFDRMDRIVSLLGEARSEDSNSNPKDSNDTDNPTQSDERDATDTIQEDETNSTSHYSADDFNDKYSQLQKESDDLEEAVKAYNADQNEETATRMRDAMTALGHSIDSINDYAEKDIDGELDDDTSSTVKSMDEDHFESIVDQFNDVFDAVDYYFNGGDESEDSDESNEDSVRSTEDSLGSALTKFTKEPTRENKDELDETLTKAREELSRAYKAEPGSIKQSSIRNLKETIDFASNEAKTKKLVEPESESESESDTKVDTNPETEAETEVQDTQASPDVVPEKTLEDSDDTALEESDVEIPQPKGDEESDEEDRKRKIANVTELSDEDLESALRDSNFSPEGKRSLRNEWLARGKKLELEMFYDNSTNENGYMNSDGKVFQQGDRVFWTHGKVLDPELSEKRGALRLKYARDEDGKMRSSFEDDIHEMVIVGFEERGSRLKLAPVRDHMGYTKLANPDSDGNNASEKPITLEAANSVNNGSFLAIADMVRTADGARGVSPMIAVESSGRIGTSRSKRLFTSDNKEIEIGDTIFAVGQSILDENGVGMKTMVQGTVLKRAPSAQSATIQYIDPITKKKSITSVSVKYTTSDPNNSTFAEDHDDARGPVPEVNRFVDAQGNITPLRTGEILTRKTESKMGGTETEPKYQYTGKEDQVVDEQERFIPESEAYGDLESDDETETETDPSAEAEAEAEVNAETETETETETEADATAEAEAEAEAETEAETEVEAEVEAETSQEGPDPQVVAEIEEAFGKIEGGTPKTKAKSPRERTANSGAPNRLPLPESKESEDAQIKNRLREQDRGIYNYFEATTDYQPSMSRFGSTVRRKTFSNDRQKANYIFENAPVGFSMQYPETGAYARKVADDKWEVKEGYGEKVYKTTSERRARRVVSQNGLDNNQVVMKSPSKRQYEANLKETQRVKPSAFSAAPDKSEATLDGQTYTKQGDVWASEKGDTITSRIAETDGAELTSMPAEDIIARQASLGGEYDGDITLLGKGGESLRYDKNKKKYLLLDNREIHGKHYNHTELSEKEASRWIANNVESNDFDSKTVRPRVIHNDPEANAVKQNENPSIETILDGSGDYPAGTKFTVNASFLDTNITISGWKSPEGSWTAEGVQPGTSKDSGRRINNRYRMEPTDGTTLNEIIEDQGLEVDLDSAIITQPSKKVDLGDSDTAYPTPDLDREMTQEDVDNFINTPHANVDFSGATLQEIAGAFYEKTGVNPGITAFQGSERVSDNDILPKFRSNLEGLYQMYSKYPWMDPLLAINGNVPGAHSTIGSTTHPDSVRANYAPTMNFGESVSSNGKMVSAFDDEKYKDHLANVTDEGRYTAHHEAGHLFDASRKGLSPSEAENQFEDWVAELLGESYARLQNMDYQTIRERLKRFGISNYGASKRPNKKDENNDKGTRSVMKEEVYAESIADIEQNGSNASESSKFFYTKLMQDAHNRRRFLEKTGMHPRNLTELKKFVEDERNKK